MKSNRVVIKTYLMPLGSHLGAGIKTFSPAVGVFNDATFDANEATFDATLGKAGIVFVLIEAPSHLLIGVTVSALSLPTSIIDGNFEHYY